MSDLLIVVAVALMISLAAARLVRVRLGRTPLPEGRERLILMLVLVAVPPLALSPVVDRAGGLQGGIPWVVICVAMLAGLAILASLLAQFVGYIARGRLRRLVRRMAADHGQAWARA